MAEPLQGHEVHTARELIRSGIEPWRGAAAASFTRARRGTYVDSARWHQLSPLQRHQVLVIGTLDSMSSQPLLSHHAAAAVWGLPILGKWPQRIDVLVDTRQGSSGHVHRWHVPSLPEPVYVSGFAVTSAARTVLDVVRSSSLAAGLVIADAALRHELCTPADLDAELAAVPGRARGLPIARAVIAIADAGSESVGESLSRAGMYAGGLPQPQLQVEVRDADGLIGWSDFGWEQAVGEFDGMVKYGLTAGSPANALALEKTREDRIRRNHRIARWIWADALTRVPMLHRLGEIGIRPDRGAQWLRSPLAHVPAAKRRRGFRAA
ncbi:hypothetical protein G9U51_05240 [Calidifontibacter sp. DB0510]|uniref:Transcriptional regulator, AbiEi antitoxin, Type IV TA system n=1 Tax=Metallococcus carri TaxID=1656884 RepID=A0A967AYU2_9MICO|nr:hypothetical protein [Metallococcus carri]NHN55193.1 hypothetical protein [Metallococcus carri]NOP36270.1 hypothetical protein [Calidifontibacter sp. DB2511S]